MSFQTELERFKNYISNTNTIENPLDKLFPNTRKKVTGEEPPKIVDEPLKKPLLKVVDDLKKNTKKTWEDIKKGTVTLFTLLVVGTIFYLVATNKD